VPYELLEALMSCDLTATEMKVVVCVVRHRFGFKDARWAAISQRELAELTGASVNSVVAALKSLTASGWVELVEPATRTSPARYTVPWGDLDPRFKSARARAFHRIKEARRGTAEVPQSIGGGVPRSAGAEVPQNTGGPIDAKRCRQGPPAPSIDRGPKRASYPLLVPRPESTGPEHPSTPAPRRSRRLVPYVEKPEIHKPDPKLRPLTLDDYRRAGF